MTEKSSSLDVLGIKPVADAALEITRASTSGAGAFLSRICLPAAEEFGLLLQDKVRHWRSKNAREIEVKASLIYEGAHHREPQYAHPKLVGTIIEHGSWEDDGRVQELWAGLLASSCSDDGSDRSNQIYVGILSELTTSQAKILAHICEACGKSVLESGLLSSATLELPASRLLEVAGLNDIHALDVEIDSLRTKGLLWDTSTLDHSNLESNDVTPSALALHFYARCRGHRGSAIEFYGAVPEEAPATQVAGAKAQTGG